MATGETEGYYADYEVRPAELFGRALAEGFIFQGQTSAFLKGRRRGEPSGHLPSQAFVSFLQTHDQVGNRALGERLHAIGDWEIIRAARACVLLSPHVPMFFMGEEYAASTPFQFFCDFGPDLATAVTEGRRKEFAHFASFSEGDESGQATAVPDPNALTTFMDSKLRWEERTVSPHAAWLEDTRVLLYLRHERVVPLLSLRQEPGGFHCSEGGTFWVEWRFRNEAGEVTRLSLVTQLGEGTVDVARPLGRTLYTLGTRRRGSMSLELSRGAVHFTINAPHD